MHTSTFWLKFGSINPTVTPKSNQHFIMSQCYIHANLFKIHLPVHEISCKQESVTLTPTPTPTPTLTPTPTGSAPKQYAPQPTPPHPSSSVGDIISANSDSRNDKDAAKFYAAGFRRVWFIASEQGRL